MWATAHSPITFFARASFVAPGSASIRYTWAQAALGREKKSIAKGIAIPYEYPEMRMY